jgi:hypothetical protein
MLPFGESLRFQEVNGTIHGKGTKILDESHNEVCLSLSYTSVSNQVSITTLMFIYCAA